MASIERRVASRGWQVDESLRAEAMAAYDIEALRDTVALRRITEFAAALCEVPIALVSLVEETRQTFIARTGLAADETPSEASLCQYAMRERDIMEVRDATRDPRFADNPLVCGDPHIRFYAGAPLATDAGIPLGSLCVIDTIPRDGLNALQRQGLLVLAADVMARFEASRHRTIGVR